MSIFWLIFGYLAGSCPTGYLAVKILKGLDVRDFGSGNIGATQTQAGCWGKKWAVAVAVFDMLKGGMAVLLASFFTDSSIILALTGVFSVLGHNYPVWQVERRQRCCYRIRSICVLISSTLSPRL